MIVSLERSGGFTGRRVVSSIDIDELATGQRSDALCALEELAAVPETGPPAARSQPTYRLTIHRPAGPQLVQLVESQIPAALRPLLNELIRRGQPQP